MRKSIPEHPLAVATVPVPAVYFDELMPALTDAEWRVLCVVLRQILGWSDPASPTLRKERDWITQSQFRWRTGKSRDSLSRAIASLVELGLIQVENESGESLRTASSRRLARQRLYYRPIPISPQITPISPKV